MKDDREVHELLTMYVVTFVLTLLACLWLLGCGNVATEVEDCHPFDAPCWESIDVS